MKDDDLKKNKQRDYKYGTQVCQLKTLGCRSVSPLYILLAPFWLAHTCQ